MITATRKLATPRPAADALDRACLAARTASELKGRDVVVLDMRAVTPLYDFMILVTGSSRRQMHALAEDVDAALKGVGDVRIGIEGYESSKWIVQDYGDIVVHIFDGSAREYYSLEDLWADAPRIDWQRA